LTRFVIMLWAALCAAMLTLTTAHAQLEIDITKGNIDPTPIAIPSFLGTDSQTRDLGAQISEVIRADLERSGLFKSLDPASFLETQTNIDYQPTFADWRIIKAEALVSGRIVTESPTKIRVEFPKTNRKKRLAIMDQDGYAPQFLLAGSDLVITPRFSPSAQKITFMSYENVVPQVYLLDIETGRRELLGNFPGMTFAPRFSPDGKFFSRWPKNCL